MKITIEAEPKEIAALALSIQGRRPITSEGEPKNDPKRLPEWRRFELSFDDGSPEQLELYDLLDRTNITRHELALITLGLRVRPEFSLRDFGT